MVSIMTKSVKVNLRLIGSLEEKGITLTELLVASVLVGIVMIGVASFSISIKHLQNSTNKSTIMEMKTKSAMARVVKDAYLAVGDIMNPGIVAYSAGQNLSICFRQDVNNPSSYADDIWKCYFRGASNDLLACNVPPQTVPVQSLGHCNGGGSAELLLEIAPSQNVFYQLMETPSGQLEYVQMSLAGIFDQTAAAHPILNPTHTLITQISPPGHSW
jgi:Tfp pilus assembly protein PilE